MSASVYSIEHPTARKEHVCCECEGTIKPGEKYELYKGIWDGEADRFKTCADCEALRGEVMEPDEEFIFGELYDHCHYHGPARILQYIAIRRKRGKVTKLLKEIEQRLKNETAVMDFKNLESGFDGVPDQFEKQFTRQGKP